MYRANNEIIKTGERIKVCKIQAQTQTAVVAVIQHVIIGVKQQANNGCRNVGRVGWQVTPFDPVWHVSFHSGEAGIERLLLLLLLKLLLKGQHNVLLRC